MRSVDSRTSSASSRALMVAAIQRSAAPVAGPASSWTRASHRASTPARASVSATSHGASTPRSSSASITASSASAASSAPSASSSHAATTAWCWRRTSCSACSRETPEETNRSMVEAMTSSASAMSLAARVAAAAGLLSSWARPAAIVPREASRSRFCSTAVRRPRTGATWCMIRRCTERWLSASSVNGSAATVARRHSVARDHPDRHDALGEHRDRAHPRRPFVAPDRLEAIAVDVAPPRRRPRTAG